MPLESSGVRGSVWIDFEAKIHPIKNKIIRGSVLND
jgi:hypothetical protein